jgi:hypothetical protein
MSTSEVYPFLCSRFDVSRSNQEQLLHDMRAETDDGDTQTKSTSTPPYLITTKLQCTWRSSTSPDTGSSGLDVQ